MKTFYSAEDIEALIAQGRTELSLDEDTVLTQLARDTALRLGLKLVRRPGAAPAPARTGGTPPTILAHKPRGCQHGPLTANPPASPGGAARAEGVIDELVDLVRQLSNKDAQG